MNNTTRSTQKLTGLGIFSAIIIVLSVFCTFVKFGPVNITLALAPMVIGGAVYGASSGAILGFVFSLITLIAGVLGWDGGFVMLLMGINPLATLAVIFVKGTAAGWLATLVYRAVEKKHPNTAALWAGMVCPIVNTGLFLLGMYVFFLPTLEAMAAGQNLIAFMVFGLCGINFVVEFVVNVALAGIITRIVKLRRRSGKAF